MWESYPALVGLESKSGPLPQISCHVGEGLRAALIVSVMSRQCAHQLLRGPLAVLRRESRREAARRQRICQLQWAYSKGGTGEVGIERRH